MGLSDITEMASLAVVVAGLTVIPALEAALNRLNHIDVPSLDDLAYITKDQAESSAQLELLGPPSTRYERRSMMITANQPFGEWSKVFEDPAVTLATVDWLVHHTSIFEMYVESYHRRTAIERRQVGAGWSASPATQLRSTSALPDSATTNRRREASPATIKFRHDRCAARQFASYLSPPLIQIDAPQHPAQDRSSSVLSMYLRAKVDLLWLGYFMQIESYGLYTKCFKTLLSLRLAYPHASVASAHPFDHARV